MTEINICEKLYFVIYVVFMLLMTTAGRCGTESSQWSDQILRSLDRTSL